MMGRGCLPQPSLPAWPGCVCGLGGGEQCRGASTIPRPGSPPPQFARCGRSETCRIPRLPPEEAGGWVGGWGGSKLPSSERKPRSCEAPNGEVRKSGRPPLPRPPPTLAAPLSSRPQPPVPGQSLPYLPQQRRPRRRRLDPASCKSPGAPRVAGGQAGRPTRGGGAPPAAAAPGPLQAKPDAPRGAPAGSRRPPPLPPPAGAPQAPGGPDARAAGDAGRAGPGPARTRRGRLCSRLAGSALAPPGPPPTPRPPPPPAPAAPSPAAAAPLLSPAPLFSPFFPFLRGGASRAEPGAGRRGEEEEEAEDGEKEEERGELLPPTRLPALPNLSLSETGSRIGSQRLHYGLHQAL